MIFTPGSYLKHRRTAAGLAIAEVAAIVATEPRWAEHLRVEWIERIEADIMPASFNTVVALRRAYPFDFDVLATLAAIALGASLDRPRLCRICACSGADACLGRKGACSWVDTDLCSACFYCDPEDRLVAIQSAAAAAA